MTSPLSITSIPPEVLGEIFTHASLNDADAPITIGSVSRTFHRTVRTTPPAWTNLKLKMREPADDGRCIRKAELWFTMAGACLVDLSVQMEMENVMEVALSLHAIGTPSGSTSTAPVKENIPAGWLGSSIVVLPDVLHNYAQCIRAFSLHTTNIAEARVFLSAMYSTPLLQGSIPSYPLQELELRTSSDGTRSPMTPRTHGQATCVTLPRLTNLERLNLVNHPVPLTCLSNVDSVRNLRQLKVVCPLRFAPIPVGSLIGVLKAARGLEIFELDARLTEESPSQGTTSFPPTPSTPSFAIPLGTPTPTPTSATFSAWGHPSDSQHHDLITLPFLDYLSLRVNNLPALLNQLLLPSLRTLKIEDLDGNRRGGGQESGVMLRHVLVRMELPCEYKLDKEDEDRQHRPPRFVRPSRGLEVLEMTSVPVCIGSGSGGTRGSSSRSSSRDRGDERRPPSNECVWEWCFRRMRTLRELRICKMDTGTVLDLITQASAPPPPTPSSEVGISVVAPAMAEDAVLPRLEKVKIGHCTSFVGPARGRNANPEGALLKFRVRRPEVEVEWNVVDNLRIRSRQTSAARPAFLELLSP